MERKEAIEIIKKNYPDSSFTMLREALETLIPELKESEDERMWKLIKKYAHYNISDTALEADHITREQLETWLEKQGEHANFLSKIQVGDKVTLNEDGVLVNLTQLKRVANKVIENAIKEKQGEKPKVNLHVKCIANKVEPFDKYEGLTDFERTLTDICIGWIGEEPGWKQYIKDNADVLLKIAAKNFNSVQDAASEQKLAWSEEDEKMLNSFLHKLEVCDLLSNKEGVWIKNKLKNIKGRVQPQSTWKPSDEQIKAVKEAVCYSSVFSEKTIDNLISLSKDLKKLKGE